nr:nuclease [Klebsiella pneumoniae]
GVGRGVDKLPDLLRLSLQDDGPVALAVFPQQIIHRPGTAASPYAKKYTSGVLSFAEQDLPPGQREKLMASFERVLMPGLDK